MPVYGDKRFKNPARTIIAFNKRELEKAFEDIEAFRARYFLLGYVRYEARDAFAGKAAQSSLPLLYFEAFEGFEPYTPGLPAPFVLDPRPAMRFEDYAAALRDIKEEIACGNTYEVNYTYDLALDGQGREPFELYEYLLSKQKTPYNAFIQNEYDTLLSFSPELFFDIDYRAGAPAHIVTKPMKGTIRRGQNAEEDARLAAFLRHDIKNRAENVMIVDLLRNDLGRVARTGSVRVSRLFEIETHPTLHQMTSQIEADLKDGASLYDVFKAIFPCGSVTGAPKISTMNIISRLERGSRNIYCGAIGFLQPGRATFSVPIRIVQKQARETRFTCRVGGAIVWDSDTQEEWRETLTKARFLSSDFYLIETMLVRDGVIIFRREHCERMRRSAAFFGFAFDAGRFPRSGERDGILRLLLDKQGTVRAEYRDLAPSPGGAARISPLSVKSGDPFLYHKTSYRPYFQTDYTVFYDELFFNERGELTEGSRTNVVLDMGGCLYTPPVSSGLLNGVCRQKMLDSGECRERVLYRDDLLRAERVYCVNSVRGMQEVRLV